MTFASNKSQITAAQPKRTNKQTRKHTFHLSGVWDEWLNGIYTQHSYPKRHQPMSYGMNAFVENYVTDFTAIRVFFFVKTKRRRREKRERKHAGAHNVLLQWNHWNRRKNRKLCKREVCQQKLLFFLSSLLFLCWSRFSSHTLSISSYSSICLFSEFWAWNQSQRRFQFKYTNKQTNKKPAGAEQSRVEQDKIASKL